ncbi:hypothetical protein GC170_14460 [bacterium]|nr:hypothetical protein [bacterium]
MSDITRITARMRLNSYGDDVERRVRQAHRRAGMELRDNVKQSINRPGYQIRQKGEIMTSGFVIRKAQRVDIRDSSGRFLKGQNSGPAFARSARGLVAKKNEINYDVIRSKPGEPPRRQRGTLWNSITFESRDSFRGVVTRVGPSVRTAKYSRALELGYAPNNLEPRPFLAPAGKAYDPTFMALMERAVRGAKP